MLQRVVVVMVVCVVVVVVVAAVAVVAAAAAAVVFSLSRLTCCRYALSIKYKAHIELQDRKCIAARVPECCEERT